MKKSVKNYLDNIFTARQLPYIAWGAFLPHLIACVKADGGTWNEIHGYFEFPPKITGGSWQIVSSDEIFYSWWWETSSEREKR